MATSARGQAVADWSPTLQWSAPELFRCPDAATVSRLVKEAASGQTDRQTTLGRLKLSSCKGMFDPVEGVRLLGTAATKGDAHAQLALADSYRTGLLGRADPANAVFWYRKAALQDSVRARNSWALALYLGFGTEKQPAAAFKLFRISAQQGLREAEYNLGALYDLGKGGSQSYQYARQWYLKAANQRDGAAQYRLGMMWEQGLGGERSQETAIQWYEKAEQNRSPGAMLRLGLESSRGPENSGYFLYTAGVAMLYGNGLPKDEARGVALLHRAADQQHYSAAYFQLGEAYANGLGVKKNEARAIEYYEALLATDRNMAVAYNNIAWIRVTTSDAKIHNPQKALEYALKAVELSEGRQAYAIDTLAFAYFQAGQIDKAIETENKALALQPQSPTYVATLSRFRDAQRLQQAAR
jgi:TPR repeat protein